MRRFVFLLVSLFQVTGILWAQDKIVSRKNFFLENKPLEVTVTTDLKKLVMTKKNPTLQPANLTWRAVNGGEDIVEPIRIRLRGNNRRENCNLASLMVDFRVDSQKTKTSNLKEMKWVAPCARGIEGEQFVLKEYLIYKMYNMFTDLSFRVRLLHITFEDANKKQKPYTQYGFAIEHVDDLRKRNNCSEEKKKQYLTIQTERNQALLVSIFQYMIGNTDWSVPNYHNVKLLIPKDSSTLAPLIVPYDFDYAGLVNAPYAVPHETWGIEKVTDRKYLGFPRTLEEIKAVTDKFGAKKDDINNLINNFELLTNYHKKEMSLFIAQFYKILESDRDIKVAFIDNARTK